MATINDIDKFKVDVPEGESGPWSVRRYEVTREDEQLQMMRAVFSGSRRYVPAGTYTKLQRGSLLGGEIIMSDTPDEIRDHMPPIRKTREFVKMGSNPRCLVNGLGLGMITRGLLLEGAKHVTVVELEEDVIQLVGPWLEEQFRKDQLTIIHADALTWRAPVGSRWEIVWHDIWDNICADNLAEMSKLHRRYGGRVLWQGSWAKDECQFARDRIASWAR